MEKSSQEVMYSYKCFNSSYIESVGFEICEKLIWTSGEGCRIINTISKQVIPKSNMKMTSSSSTLGVVCSPHKYTCDILS